MNNRHVVAIKDWFTLFWHSSFVSQIFIPYSGIILKLTSSIGSNPNIGSATIMVISKLPPCMFPQIFSKLLNYTELFIHSYVPTEYFLCMCIKLF